MTVDRLPDTLTSRPELSNGQNRSGSSWKGSFGPGAAAEAPSMISPDDILAAPGNGVLSTEIEELIFLVGPKAAVSQKTLLRVKPRGARRHSPTASPESAAWGLSPADRYFQGQLREHAGVAGG